MPMVVRSFGEVLHFHGVAYVVRVCGRLRDDGIWEGWLEFEPDDGSDVLRTPRETTQPNLAALEYWASGLTAVYLEGAFARAVHAELPAELPTYQEPAPEPRLEAAQPEADAPVLNPFSLYVEGEDALRRRLAVLNHRALRTIVRAFDLVGADELDLDALDEPSLVDLIVAAVRARLAT